MAQSTLGPGDAWQWIVTGWNGFLKNPVMWVVTAVIYIVSLFVLNLVPGIGALLAALVTPVLIGGMLHGVREQAQGREVTPGHLFQVFQDQPRLIQLALLGLVPLVITLLRKALIASAMPQGMAELLSLLLSLASGCILLFGLPLILFDNKPVIDAVVGSLRACLDQPVAVGVFLVLAVVLAIVAMIPLGVGLLVYLPVMVGAVYASYQQVKPS